MKDLPDSFVTLLFRKDKEKLTDAELFIQQAQYTKRDFDPAIVDYLQTGYFDSEELHKVLSSLNNRELKNKTEQTLNSVWQLFNSNFRPNSSEVLNAFKIFVSEHWAEIGFGELKQICDLFSALDQPDLALQWQTEFIRSRLPAASIEMVEFFKNQTSDSKVLEEISEREKELQKGNSLRSIVYKLVETRGWNPKDEAALNSFTESDYYQWFETEADVEFLTVLRSFYQTFIAGSKTGIWESIAKKFKAALIRLSQRSNLDRYRIQVFFNFKDTGEQPDKFLQS